MIIRGVPAVRLNRWFAVLIILALSFGLAAPDILAATKPEDLNLTTSPLPIDLVTKPGTTITTDLRVKNSSNHAEHLRVDVLKFGAFGNEGKPQLLPKAPGDEFLDWASFSPKRFTADPGVWVTVRMSINVPTTAAFGYYYAVVFSRDNPSLPSGNRVTGLEGGVATLVLLEAQAPGAKKTLEIVGFKSKKKVYEFLPAVFNITLHNSGNVHTVPSGSVFINKGDKQLAVLSMNPGGGNVLPQTNRAFTVRWESGFPSYVTTNVNGKDKTSLKWDFGKIQQLRFGHYKATLVAVYDNGQRDVPVEATVGFWVIPWRILFVFLLLLAVIGFGLWTMGRNFWRRVGKGRKNAKRRR